MLSEINSYRKLLQMPLLRSVESSLLSTIAHPSIDNVPSEPAMPSKGTLESMPPEILDRIASFVRGDDILRWCHAVPYFKYISKAMYDFGYPIRTRHQPGAVLSKHGGYARIDDSTGITVLGALPEDVEVWVHHSKLFLATVEFFGALYDAKKNIRELYFGGEYFERCGSDPASLDMTAKWLVKLPIHGLRFWGHRSIPTQILNMLHLMPMLDSLHVPNLEDCKDISFAECKLLRKLYITNVFEGEESPEVLVQKVVDFVEPTKIRGLATYLPSDWQSFLRNDLRLRPVSTYDQDTSTTVNSICRIPQMPPLEIIASSFLTQPVSTASCVSTDSVLSKPVTAVIPTLESMPPEILDLIASFVEGISILRLCHAVRYYKYISQAMFDIGYPLTLQKSSKFAQLNFWPCAYLRKPSDGDVFATMPIPASHMHAFETYSNILSKHGGYASIDSTSMTMVGALPKNMVVDVGHATPSPATDKFFGALHNAKKNIWQLSLGYLYFTSCESDPDSLVVTAKWLVKLRIHELHFQSSSGIPMEIRGMLHLMPMLKSLYLRKLGDCAGIAFSEFKMLKKLMISDLFVGRENPEELVQHVVNVLKPTKIQQ
ncbi:hypothetical protein HDU78_011192, partial [Chytriomyces hyalinus]